MKKFISLLAIILLCGSCSISKKKSSPTENYAVFDWFEYNGYDPIYEGLEPGPDEYLNPILSGFYPDPSIVRVEDDYYLVNSTFSFFPGIPIFHSKDLVNWHQIGHVLDRPSQLVLDSLDISHGVFAPAISYHDGLYYVVNTIVYGLGNFVVTATNPAGPWSDPVMLPIEGIDPSLFFDSDGKAYLVNNGAPDRKPLYEGHRAIWIQEFNKDSLKLVGPRKVIIDGGVDINQKPIWIEGPHLYKINGYYYLSAAEGGTSVNHSQVVFRSKKVWGPYKPWDKNPILTQRHLDPNRPNPVTCTGHADIVETQNGEWWAVFLGCTPYADDYYNTGRQTFLLPVSWQDDWPLILSGNDLVPYSHSRPDLPLQDSSLIPLNGNFSIRDEFSDTSLAMVWSFIRTPYEKWHNLKKDKLLIKARNVTIAGKGQPSFIGRRQQHHYCSAITSLQFNPETVGDKAGLCVFQNEQNYYLLALTRKPEGKFITLEKGSSESPEELADVLVEFPDDQSFQLKTEARGRFYDFYYALNPDQWELIEKDIDATWLSTHVAGGFVGAYFGMYVFTSKK